MLNISTKLKTEFSNQDVSVFAHKLHIFDVETNTTTIVDYGIKDLKESIGIDGIPIGKFPIGILSFKLTGNHTNTFRVNGDYEVRIEDTYTFADSTTESFMSKTYSITKIEFDKKSNVTIFEGYDFANELNVKYESLEHIEYPCTFEEFVQEYYLSLGFAVDLTNLYNADFVLTEAPVFDESTSCLEVARNIGKFALSVQFMDSNNTIKFVRASKLKTSNVTSEEFINLKSFSVDSDYFKTLGVNTLVLGLSSDIDSENVSKTDSSMTATDDNVELRLDDLAFAWNQDIKLQVIDEMFEEVKGFKYKSFELEGKQFYYEIGDIVAQTGAGDSGDSFNVLILDKEIIRNGSMITKYKANVQSTKQTEYKWSEFTPLKRTEILVDKANRKIELVVENQELLEERLIDNESSIELLESEVILKASQVTTDNLASEIQEVSGQLALTSQSLQVEISDRVTQKDEILEEVSSQLSLTKSELNLLFERLESEQELTNGEVQTLQSWFRVNENGALIGNSGSPIELRLTNNKVQFVEGSKVISEWQEGTMNVDNLVAKLTIVIGTHLVTTYNSNTVGLSTIIQKVGG